MTVSITPLGTAPNRGDPANFRTVADEFLEDLPVLKAELEAQITENNSINAGINSNLSQATASKVAATTSATNAATSATATAALSPAANWVSGTSYLRGNVRKSLVNGMQYVRTTDGAGTVDPANDSTNWELDFLTYGSGLPNVFPTLLLDPVNSGVVDPRIVTTRNSTATYWDEFGVLRTAPANTLRIDHNPLTGERLGYLIEGAATNLLLHSENLGGAGWAIQNCARSLDFATSLTGELSADLLVENSTFAAHGCTSPVIGFTSGIVYCPSAFVKPMGRSRIQLALSSGPFGGVFPIARFDLIDGQVISSGDGATNPLITPLPNGWFRISFAVTATANGTGQFIFQMVNGAQNNYTGDGVSGMLIWGAQVEDGVTRPTSYIPTEGAAATRAADVPVISGAAFSDFYNQSEGTLVIEFLFNNKPNNLIEYLRIHDGAGNFANRITINTGAWAPTVSISMGLDGSRAKSGFNIGDRVKVAVSYKVGEFSAAINGEHLGVDSTFLNQVFPSVMTIGSIATAQNPNTPSRLITYYPKAVTASELRALSRI
jgi:hypothetical protein